MNRTKDELKNMFTTYWSYLTISAACKLNIFDLVKVGENTYERLLDQLTADKLTLRIFLDSLVQLGFLKKRNGILNVTEKSSYLIEDNPETLKNACILWGMEHMDAWQFLDKTILAGKPSFDNYFEYISDKPYKFVNYHKAMYEYAIEDYRNITSIVNFEKYEHIMDVGGGMGVLIQNIKKEYPFKRCSLFEKPEVIALVSNPELELIKGDFFSHITGHPDCIILSRVIHDWEDSKALVILKNAYQALQTDGQLILIENFADKLKDKALLLSLNMMLMCKSYERTEDEYMDLLKLAKFKVLEIRELNELQNIIIVNK